MSGELIGRWKYELAAHKAEAFPGQGQRPPEQQRIHEFEEEIRWLRMERAILKKATAFFCQGEYMRYRFIDEQKKAWHGPPSKVCSLNSANPISYTLLASLQARQNPITTSLEITS